MSSPPAEDKVRVILHADNGFAREALMAWYEENAVNYLFGLAYNTQLVEQIPPLSPK